MDAELKTKWVAALRSGKYEQGRGQLRTINDLYCCLGVLGDLMLPNGWEPHPSGKGIGFTLNGSYSMLPVELNTVADLYYGDERTLVGLNDVEGADFNRIADYIEEKL